MQQNSDAGNPKLLNCNNLSKMKSWKKYEQIWTIQITSSAVLHIFLCLPTFISQSLSARKDDYTDGKCIQSKQLQLHMYSKFNHILRTTIQNKYFTYKHGLLSRWSPILMLWANVAFHL